MKKILLMLILVFIGGCSSTNTDFSEFLSDENYYNKNIDIKGNLKFYQDGFYYVVDKNNVKIKLVECYDKYNLVLGKEIQVNGYLTKDGNKVSLICKNHDKSVENFTSKVQELELEIKSKETELLSTEENKNNKISELNSKISNLNSQISNKNSDLSKLTNKIDNATKQKEINEIKNEILTRANIFPVPVKIEDFKQWVMLNQEVYKTDFVDLKGFNQIDYYKDTFYRQSMTNKEYSIKVIAVRDKNSQYYKSYNIIVERNEDKWTCSRN